VLLEWSLCLTRASSGWGKYCQCGWNHLTESCKMLSTQTRPQPVTSKVCRCRLHFLTKHLYLIGVCFGEDQSTNTIFQRNWTMSWRESKYSAVKSEHNWGPNVFNYGINNMLNQGRSNFESEFCWCFIGRSWRPWNTNRITPSAHISLGRLDRFPTWRSHRCR
jgi:hypothetical protein